ncbi:MAG: class I SAM-dependent methyltransferase [Spirochaetes bacterium]|nr:class I SAM-dependent methyltransferase [Spirochaetota bacterium]
MTVADIAYSPLHAHITPAQLALLESYATLLTTVAMSAGYIGECSADEVRVRHMFDAILPAIAPESRPTFPLVDTQGLKVFDLGAGAGLPSVPLAILFPEHDFFLIDAQEKRCKFVLDVARELKLTNVRVHHGVVQNFDRPERADIVIFRAFRKILASLELSLFVLPERAKQIAPKILYWRSQAVPFSAEGLKRVDDLGFEIAAFVKFASAEAIVPRGLYTFNHNKPAKKQFPRSWKKISADKLVETES